MKLTRAILAGLMGALFILYGASKFHAFMPTPEVPPRAAAFIAALIGTEYLWRMVGLIEIIGGLLLFFPRTRLAGALLLLSIIANIVPYLWLLARTLPGIPMGLFLMGVTGWILWEERQKLRVVLT